MKSSAADASLPSQFSTRSKDNIFRKTDLFGQYLSYAKISIPSWVEYSLKAEATAALLSMGFSPQEAELALDGHEEAGAVTVEKAIQFALKRLGGNL